MCKYIKSYSFDHLNKDIHGLKKLMPGSHSEEHWVRGQMTIFDQKIDYSIPCLAAVSNSCHDNKLIL